MLDRLPVDLLIMLACMMYEHADRAHLACVCRATAEAARKSDYWEHFAESYGLEDAKRLKLLAQSGRKLPVVQVRLSYRYEEGQDDYMVSDFQMLPFLIGLVDIVHPGVEEFCFAFRSPDTRINLPPPLFNDMFSNLATLELKLNYAEFCCEYARASAPVACLATGGLPSFSHASCPTPLQPVDAAPPTPAASRLCGGVFNGADAAMPRRTGPARRYHFAHHDRREYVARAPACV